MKKIKISLRNNFLIKVVLFIIFVYICSIITFLSVFCSPPLPEYVVYHITEKYNMETELIVVESVEDDKIEITNKKIISKILNKFNTVPTVKHNSDKFLFFFTYDRASWTTHQEFLDSKQNKKTLIFNNSCKITIYGNNTTYNYFRVEYNGKMNKYETVEKGFYDDIMALVNEGNSTL